MESYQSRDWSTVALRAVEYLYQDKAIYQNQIASRNAGDQIISKSEPIEPRMLDGSRVGWDFEVVVENTIVAKQPKRIDSIATRDAGLWLAMGV